MPSSVSGIQCYTITDCEQQLSSDAAPTNCPILRVTLTEQGSDFVGMQYSISPLAPQSSELKGSSCSMENCVLQPPNNRLLSTDVIGNVMLRSKFSRHSYGDDMSMDNGNPMVYQPALQQPDFHATPPMKSSARRRGPHQNDPATILAPRIHHQQSMDLSGSCSTSHVASDAMVIERSTIKMKPTTNKDQARVIAELVLAERRRTREMRRMRQIRYRKKKDDYANRLDEENKQLRDEIQQLERRRRSVSATIPANENAWSTVVEYFRLFRFGLRELLTTARPSSSLETQTCAQRDFVLTSMTSDVVFNGERGIEAIMKSWFSISNCFASIDMQLDGMEKDANRSIIATTVTTVTFSKHTLVNLFPHLCRTDGRGQVVSPLGEKLVDQTIVMRGPTYFEWDSAYCRIQSIQDHSDMLTPMLRVLGTLEDVSRVFDKALITPDFHCRLKTNSSS